MRRSFNDEIAGVKQVEVVKVQRNEKWREEQVKVVQRNLVESQLTVDTNYSIFDQENSIFVTEQSWNLGSNITDKKKLQNLIEIL